MAGPLSRERWLAAYAWVWRLQEDKERGLDERLKKKIQIEAQNRATMQRDENDARMGKERGEARTAEEQRRNEGQRKGQERGHDGRKEQTAKGANCPAHRERPKRAKQNKNTRIQLTNKSRRQKLEKHAIIGLDISHQPRANDCSTWTGLYTTGPGTAMCIIVSLFRVWRGKVPGGFSGPRRKERLLASCCGHQATTSTGTRRPVLQGLFSFFSSPNNFCATPKYRSRAPSVFFRFPSIVRRLHRAPYDQYEFIRRA